MSPAGRSGLVAWGRRSITLVDQGMSSLSNVLAVILVARTLDESAFGRFSVGYAVMIAALSVSRAWFGTRLSLIPDAARVATEARRAIGALLLLAAPSVLLVLAITWLLTGRQIDSTTVVVALSTPVVCAQDALRFAAVAGKRPGFALASDSLWVVVLVALIPAGTWLGSGDLLWLWLLAATLALAVLLAGLRVTPDVAGGWAGLRERDATRESVTVGFVVTLAATLTVTGFVATALSSADVGSMRGASTVMGPLNVLMAFVNLALTPWLVARDRARDLRNCAAIAGSSVIVTAAWVALVLSLPSSVGTHLLGDSWAGTRAVLPFMSLEYLGMMVALAGMQGLKVRAEARKMVQQRVAVACLMVLAGAIGVWVVGDVRAVSAGLALAAVFGAVLAWVDLRASMRTTPPGAASSEVVATPGAGR